MYIYCTTSPGSEDKDFETARQSRDAALEIARERKSIEDARWWENKSQAEAKAGGIEELSLSEDDVVTVERREASTTARNKPMQAIAR